MGVFEDFLADFGRRLGLERLSPGPGGSVDLNIEKVGRLQLEESGDWFLATLARPAQPHAINSARALLEQAHWRENHPWTIHPGMKGDEWRTLTARVPLAEIDVPMAERMIEALSRQLDAVEAAG